MLSLSAREKKLLTIALVLAGFVFWNKIFSGQLLPKFHRLNSALENTLLLQEKLTNIRLEKSIQEEYLESLRQDISQIRKKFPQNSGFLLSFLGSFLRDDLNLQLIEYQEVEDKELYQIRPLKLNIQGSFYGILDYLKVLEATNGVSLAGLLFDFHEGIKGETTLQLIMNQVFIQEEDLKAEINAFYSPYQSGNFFSKKEKAINGGNEEIIPSDQEINLMENTDEVENWTVEPGDLKLAPYTFPIL